jgi:hypothetical protein
MLLRLFRIMREVDGPTKAVGRLLSEGRRAPCQIREKSMRFGMTCD